MLLWEVEGEYFLYPVYVALQKLRKLKGVIKNKTNQNTTEHTTNHRGMFPLWETEFLSFYSARSTLEGVMQ